MLVKGFVAVGMPMGKCSGRVEGDICVYQSWSSHLTRLVTSSVVSGIIEVLCHAMHFFGPALDSGYIYVACV